MVVTARKGFHKRNQPSLCLVTVCVRGRPIKEKRSNKQSLKLLTQNANLINQWWDKLDAVVFPGGFLFLGESIGHLCYKDRIQKLSDAGFVDPIKEAVKALSRSPGALIIVGVDGRDLRNGDSGDQLCVAIDKDGIVGIGRKVFPTDGEADTMLCYDTDFVDGHRIVPLASGRKAVLSACYDMFGIADCGSGNRTRERKIQWIGTYRDKIERGSNGFGNKLTKNLNKFRQALNGVTVGIAAIHGFEGHATAFWQRHGIAGCSAALGSGFAVGAAHFTEFPWLPWKSTLAAAKVPKKHLRKGSKRDANSWNPKDHYYFRSSDGAVLVRLFSR